MSKRVEFLNCHFDNVTFDEAMAVVCNHIESRKPGFMVSLNTDIAVRLDRDTAFRSAYDAADLALMDSQPLIRLCGIWNIDVKEKLSGSDLMPRVCELAAVRGYKCFILGGKEGVPDKACENLADRYPGLEISGYSPEYGFERDDRKVSVVIARAREANPDIMFVCLGAPKSEKLLHAHLADFGVPFSFCVGAAVDFAAEILGALLYGCRTWVLSGSGGFSRNPGACSGVTLLTAGRSFLSCDIPRESNENFYRPYVACRQLFRH